MSNGTFVNVIMQGRLGRDPEVRHSTDGLAIANLTVATNTSRKVKNSDERIDETEWHRAVLWGKTAENAGKILKSGMLVAFLEGQIKTRKWTDKDSVDRYTTEVHFQNFQIVAGARDKEEGGSDAGDNGVAKAAAKGDRKTASAAPAPQSGVNQDDHPF